MSRVVAPLFHSLCSNVASKHCEAYVDDGDRGTKKNMLITSGELLHKKSPLIQGSGFLFLVAAGAISLFGYYAIMGLAPVAFVLSVFMALDIAKKQLSPIAFVMSAPDIAKKLLSAKPSKNKVA